MMRIAVCLKQVPNPDLQFQVDASGKDIRRDGMNYVLSSADPYALEEGVRLKEKHQGRLTAYSLGPKRCEEILKEAVAKGADEAVRIEAEESLAYDGTRTARILAKVLKEGDYDVILTAIQSDDFAHGLTGSMIAGLLDRPHAAVVTRLSVEGGVAHVQRELEGGVLENITVPLPAVFAVQFGINQPRYAPVAAILKAARQSIKVVTPKDVGLGSWEELTNDYSLEIQSLAPPPARGKAQMFTGSSEELGRKLAGLLREKGFVRRG